MYNHLVAAANTTAGAETNIDLPFVSDGVLQRRNNHIILSDRFKLIGAAGVGATAARARFNNPSLIVNGVPHIWPLNVSATVPDRPEIADYRDLPWDMPMDEEIVIEHTNGAADQNTVLLWLAAEPWHRNLPAGKPFTVRATVVIAAGSENTWGTAVAIVMERDLLQGVYCVVGCNVVAANALAFRMVFAQARLYNGRQLRPGNLVQNTATTLPSNFTRKGIGEWGRFHTFELPSIQVLSDAAGGTYEVRLDLIYLGRDRAALFG